MSWTSLISSKKINSCHSNNKGEWKFLILVRWFLARMLKQSCPILPWMSTDSICLTQVSSVLPSIETPSSRWILRAISLEQWKRLSLNAFTTREISTVGMWVPLTWRVAGVTVITASRTTVRLIWRLSRRTETRAPTKSLPHLSRCLNPSHAIITCTVGVNQRQKRQLCSQTHLRPLSISRGSPRR